MTVRATGAGRGLAGVAVELEQGDTVRVLAEKQHRPRPFWAFWGERVLEDELAFTVGPESVPGLVEGEALLRVRAERAGTWLRRPAPVSLERRFAVRLRPPALRLTSNPVIVQQGGAGLVVYQVGESAVFDGVRVGNHQFPGCPLPGGGTGERFSLFGVPYDFDDPRGIRLVARDEVENEASASIVQQFLPRPPRASTIPVNDGFMSRVVPEILSNTPELADRGSLLDNYLAINGELRRANAATLTDLSGRSVGPLLLRQRFLQLPASQVMAGYADRRSYTYEGREVDRQTHLGYDLASVRKAPVPASAPGIVTLARYFGIYGNTVVLDHGCGLSTLYSHLSSISVEEGAEVDRGTPVGRTGETGLAGGDHLHFTVLVGGVSVDPLEWWDDKWIQDHLWEPLGR